MAAPSPNSALGQIYGSLTPEFDIVFDKEVLEVAQEILRTTSDRALLLTAKDLFSKIVYGTPIDTGRARANWIASVGSANLTFRHPRTPYPQGGAPRTYGQTIVRRNNQILAQIKTGQSAFLTNNLPYIRRLEYGWSRQAPHGMVRNALLHAAHTYKRTFKAAYNEVAGGEESRIAYRVSRGRSR